MNKEGNLPGIHIGGDTRAKRAAALPKLLGCKIIRLKNGKFCDVTLMT